jgi:hypothetical protein
MDMERVPLIKSLGGIVQFLALVLLPTLPPNRGYTSLHSSFWGDKGMAIREFYRGIAPVGRMGRGRKTNYERGEGQKGL